MIEKDLFYYFVKDIYARLLFRIAVLEYRGYTDMEITKMLNINEEIELFTLEKIQKLKGKYRTILDMFYDMLEQMYKNVTVNEDINLVSKKKSSKFYEESYISEVYYVIETKHRKIIKMLLVFLIERAKDIDDFREKVNNLEGIFDLTIELKKEVMPLIP